MEERGRWTDGQKQGSRVLSAPLYDILHALHALHRAKSEANPAKATMSV